MSGFKINLNDDFDPDSSLDEQKIKNLISKQKLDDMRQLSAERKKYAKYVFCFICLWSIGVFIIIILSGFGGIGPIYFELGKEVLIVLLTTTLANAIGIFNFAMRWIFSPLKFENKDK